MLTISQVVKQLNSNGCKVKSKHISFVKRHYLAMYRVYMMQLYEKGYISDPTRIDEKELRRNIADMDISAMYGVSGAINLTSDQALFAYYKNRGKDDESEFLFLLYWALYFREGCIEIDKVYEDGNFRGNLSGKLKFGLRMKGCMVESRSCVPISQAVCDCIVPFEREVHSLNADEFIWCCAMQTLGIPKEEWGKDGIIDSALSHEEEVECIYGLLEGYFKASGGKYLKLLENWLIKHRWGEGRVVTEQRGLYTTVCIEKHLEVTNVLNVLLNVVNQDPDSSIVAVYGSKVFYSQKRTEYVMPFGIFQYVNNTTYEDTFLPDGSLLNGVTGDLFTEERLEEDGILYSGCPILLNTSVLNTETFYDIEQTDITYPTWCKHSAPELLFGNDVANQMPPSPFRKGTLQDEIYHGFVDSLRGPSHLITTVHVKDLYSFEAAKREVYKIIK